MQPICLFAFFAHSHERALYGMTFQNVFSGVPIRTAAPGDKVYVTTAMTLYVQMFAEEGHHTLTVAPRGFDSVFSVSFDILKEHANLFLQPIQENFPVNVDPPLNEYRVLLDGEPLTTVFLLARPLGRKS